ncbi:hypothetical protein ADEAN_000252700 [Angomonas deanei]|uniref:MORN repeat n=1 Tax=Angomonas deanei TaxID=59799 RepID=A0A7G2C7J6_9TRYP|nr:hypothetical protein ADEAN_000252700 [Angomonas deanei]
MHLNLLSFFRNNNSGSTAALFDKAVQEINPLFYPATGGGILRLFGASQGNKEQTSKEEKDYTNQLVYISPSTAQSITVPVLLEQFFQARSNTSKKKRNSAASSGGQTYIVSTAEREMVWFFGLFLSGKKHGPGMFAFPALGSLPGSPLFYNNTIQANHGGGVRRHIIQAEWLDNTLHTSDDNQKKKKQRGVWVFPTGEVYYGHFRQGKREDTEGVLLLLDGSLYVGPFKENQPCGKGLLLVKNVQEPLYRAQSRSKRCHTTEEEETEQSLLEEEEQKDHNTNAEEDNNNNIISKTVGALFSLFSSSTVAADSTTHENSLSKRYSPSYVKYLRNRKLVGFRDYFILIAEWEVQTLPTRKVFHVSKKKSSSKKDNNAIHVPILQASSCINTASNTPSYHYTPSSYDFLNYNTNTKTIPIHPNSSLADALDFLNERSEEEGEGYEHGYYEALPPPPVTTVSKVVHHGLQYFVSSNMFVYTDNHENNTIGMHIPHRPLSAYDRYITQLREQNFFNGSTHSALYMLDDNTNNNNNAKEDEVVTFFQQSSLSPIMEEFLRWKEEMAFFTANRNHQNNKNDKTAAQYFSPLQMKEGNGNFPKKDANKDQTIQSRVTANTPQRCSICEKEFSFLKKSVFCSLCFRNVCSSCLHAIEITDTSNNNVALMALADKSNKLLTTFQKIMTDLQNKKNNNDKEIEFAKYFPKSFYTTIENINNENTDEENTAESSECFYNTIPSLDVSTHPNRTVTSNSSVSVSACPDCARTVLLLNLEYQTIFIPQRMFQSVLLLSQS